MILKPQKFIRVNRGHPLSRGLVGCWLFNEGSGGKVFDASGRYPSGDLVGSWSSGKYGSAIQIANLTDYVDSKFIYNFGSITAGRGLTIVAYAKNIATSTDYQELVSMTYEAGTYDPVLQIGLDDNTGAITGTANKLYFRIRGDGGAGFDLVSYTTIEADNLWHQIIVVLNPAGMYFYLDGVLVASASGHTAAGNLDVGEELHFGNGNSRGVVVDNIWKGLISHVSIYNRALSSSEIALLYRDPFCMFDQEPIELWTAATSVVTGPLSVNVYDGISLTEDETIKSNPLKLSVYDTSSLADYINSFLNPLKLELYDSVSLTEDITNRLAQLKAGVSDDISLADYVNIILNYLFADVYDELSLSEDLTARLAQLKVSLYEDISVSEYNNQFLNLLKLNVNDSVSVTESISQFLSLLKISIDESISLSDSEDVKLNLLLLSVSEDLTVSDSILCHVTPLLISLYESIETADAVSVVTFRLNINVNVYDSIQAVDALSRVFIGPIRVIAYDVVGLGDNVSAEKPFYGLLICVFDSVSVSDIIRRRADSASWQRPESEDESTAIWSLPAGDSSVTWSKVTT